MKCPGCNFIGSDLRDICPKCLLDLREHKTRLGLTVIDPGASYAELVARATGKRDLASKETHSAEAQAEPLFGGFTPQGIADFKEAPKAEGPPHPPSNGNTARKGEHHALFTKAYEDIALVETSRDLEFSLAEFRSLTGDGACSVLFDLAVEAIDNPTKQYSELEELLSKPAVREQTSTAALQKGIKEDRRKLTTSRPSLKDLIGGKGAPTKQRPIVATPAKAPSGASSSSMRVKKPELQAAGIRERVLAFLLDLACATVFASFLASVYIMLFEPTLGTAFLFLRNARSVLLIPIFAIYLVSLLLSLLIYPLATLLSLECTLGISAVGLRIGRLTKGRKPTYANLAVRGLTFPLSLFCFGYIPLFFGKRTLHDQFAGTELYLRGPTQR